MFAVGTSMTCNHVAVNLKDHRIGIDRHLSLKRGQRERDTISRTYVEDAKDPVEIQIPSGNRFLVIFCMDKSREYIPFTLLGDPILDLLHSSAVRSIVRDPRSKLCIVGPTHVSNCSIASRTD